MDSVQERQKIPGYDHGTDKVAESPITMEEWEELKKSALFSEEDVVYLRMSEEILADQVEDLLKVWRGVILIIRIFGPTMKIPRHTRSTPNMQAPLQRGLGVG